MKFIDEVIVFVTSGKGGDGHVSFRREKYVPRGGPDGGDGGRGGSVIFIADGHRNTLIDYRRRRQWQAEDGVPGGKKQMYGAMGKDCLCYVPVGTIIYDANSGELQADLTEQGSRFEVPGGKGGLGNMHFRSSTNRTPRQYLPGEPGAERSLRLELKLLADVGLLGFPNAGKSTLLSRLSAARPKIADYPFTTLTPQLGVVELGDRQTFVLADIPGLIEGASDGAGLGHQFLKHLERCGCFIHVISPQLEDTGADGVVGRYVALQEELTTYGARLDERPQVVALGKIDTLSAEERRALVDALQEAGAEDVLPISGVSGEGLEKLVGAVWQILEAQREAGIVWEPVIREYAGEDGGADPWADEEDAWADDEEGYEE